MCLFKPINMATNVPRAEDEGCTMYIITVRQRFTRPFHPCHSDIVTGIFFKHAVLTINPCICFDSPVIQKIRRDCSKEFVMFEACLRENQDKPTTCSPQVVRFLGCAEAVDLGGVGKSPLELAMCNSR